MQTKFFLMQLAAALALGAAPAVAQHAGTDHGAMHGSHGSKGASTGIAEGAVSGGVRTFEVAVTENGFEPSKVKVKKGEKTRFVVTRKTDRTCATEIVIKDHGINRPLPMNEAVTVEFTPKKSGEIYYTCAMGHVRGVAFVP